MHSVNVLLLLLLTKIAIGEDAVGQNSCIAHIDIRIEAMQTEALIAAGQLLDVAIGQYGGLNVIWQWQTGKGTVNDLPTWSAYAATHRW